MAAGDAGGDPRSVATAGRDSPRAAVTRVRAVDRSPVGRRLASALVITAYLVGVKAAQMAWWPDPGGQTAVPGLVRQVVLATGLFGLLAMRVGFGSVAAAAGLLLRAGRGSLLVLAGVALLLGAVGAPPGLSLVNLVVVTAVGEEVLFRGLLPALVHSTQFSSRVTTFGPALAFGLWHLPDAWPSGPLVAAGVVLGTTSAALVLFEPLRRRFDSVFAPAAAHALVNGAGLLVVAW